MAQIVVSQDESLDRIFGPGKKPEDEGSAWELAIL
jgi:hypothetical protein